MTGQIQTDNEQIIRKYADMVYRLALSYTHNRMDADDVFQETFLRYVRRQPEFESEVHEKAWFVRVTVNCAKSLLTSPWRKRTQVLDGRESYTMEEEHQLDEALAQLKPEERTLIHLYYYEGYKTDEIAGILKKKPSTIRSQLTRARRKLEEIVKEDALC